MIDIYINRGLEAYGIVGVAYKALYKSDFPVHHLSLTPN